MLFIHLSAILFVGYFVTAPRMCYRKKLKVIGTTCIIRLSVNAYVNAHSFAIT